MRSYTTQWDTILNRGFRGRDLDSQMRILLTLLAYSACSIIGDSDKSC